MISTPLGNILSFIFGITNNYALAIIVLTLLIKLVLFPLSSSVFILAETCDVNSVMSPILISVVVFICFIRYSLGLMVERVNNRYCSFSIPNWCWRLSAGDR